MKNSNIKIKSLLLDGTSQGTSWMLQKPWYSVMRHHTETRKRTAVNITLFVFFPDKFVTNIRTYRIRDVRPPPRAPPKKIGMHIEIFWWLIFTKAKSLLTTVAYSEPYQTSQMEGFAETLNYFQLLTFRKTLHLRCFIGFWLRFWARTQHRLHAVVWILFI